MHRATLIKTSLIAGALIVLPGWIARLCARDHAIRRLNPRLISFQL